MYLDFYKLHLKPFQISTDPRFLWLGEKHQEALAVLKYGILDNKGFLLLTGDVGTGKTTLLNALIDSLGEDVLVAMVPDPGLAKMDFFNFVAYSFGMNKSFKGKGEFLIYLKNYLIDLNRQNKQALLIIDECQHLNQKLLEEVRLLSNIEMTNTKLINIFFVGQSEFNNIILRPHNRAIRQRITINYNISALSEAETEEYVRFRLGVAGSEEKIFTSRAIKEVFSFSNGYPRLINIVCDQSLLTGFVREKERIDERIVAECANELKIPQGRSIEESDATPEAVSEKPKVRLEEKDEALQLKNMLALMRRRLPLEKPLVIALLVVLIIWVALVTTFIFNRQSSDANNNAMDTKSTAEKTPGAVVALETPGDRGAHGGEQQNAATKANAARKEAAGNQAPESSIISPGANEGSPEKNVAVVANGQKRTLSSLASDIREDAGQRISLDDIREKYGTYPEVYFEFNGNNLDEQGYELLGVISQFCEQNPEVILILRGYTDRSGVRAYNLKLSQFRADMVKTYLVGRGVKDQSITTMAIGPGEQGPGGIKVPYDGARRKVLIEIISPNG